MGENASTTSLSAVEGYRAWASSYDRDLNPMLALEKRFLETLLPPAAGLDVVDLGCGTGRWLEWFQGMHARSLLGVDSSAEMLEIAREKLGGAARFAQADCADVCFESFSADLILCNFVLSYIEDAGAFLGKVRKMLRAGGSVFITDVHPETSSRLNWRRGVRVEDEFREIQTFHRSLEVVVGLCESANFSVNVCLEPRFGEPEREIFCASGKQEYFEEIKEHPAIYMLQLRANRGRLKVVEGETTPAKLSCIQGARIALGPETSVIQDIGIAAGRIETVRASHGNGGAGHGREATANLNGYVVLPGLVNGHDHLEFALFPRLGKGGYKNFLEWAEDIHHPGASPVFEHRQVPREVRLWWGGIRNVLSGVTTVCHHNPYNPGVFENDFVVRVLREYGWAHSLSMDGEVAAKKCKTPKGQPFLVHLAEGVDEVSAKEIFELQRADALDEETIVIHGLALGKEGHALLRDAGAGLVWCPSSNVFLFGKTLSTEELQSTGRVAIGSDSPLTAQGDLLDELRFARGVSGLSTKDLYQCATARPAELLRLKNGEGSVRAGAWADLIAVRDTGRSPCDTLAELTFVDIELVVIGGRVQLASTEMMKRLPAETLAGLQSLCIEGTVRWIRAPIARLFEQTTAHLAGEIRLGGKRVSVGN
ncbi:MAG TPA: methyltransferase domain-containing protein [Candidatus Acidoferrum sp.]|jgi:cytosine/adenosine deaminase-related metal-dependent hydrolase/ubiquinone/menaquinone biosynthesis C-methylase UbiE